MEAQQLEGGNPVKIQTFAEPNARTGASGASTSGNPQLLLRKKQPAGPQLWAIVFTIGGLYYFWTRILGRSINLPHRAHRVGSTKGHGTTTDVQTARERRLAALENANRARETMVKQAKDNGTIRERTNVNSGNNNSTAPTMTLAERQRLNQLKLQERQKQQELEEKKKKQRQLYLRQKALKEKEEEERRKDEELGPGWRAREDPSAVANLLEQQASSGGYKAPMCSRKSG
mmetsp:Transcript_22259/g.33733  ORF Transcript_22259/g.33733 Transcript_22259/m.33733 type:complete len:231 (+) Transcript_22259:133-825(+)